MIDQQVLMMYIFAPLIALFIWILMRLLSYFGF